jgi:uncharacterized protein DUF2071
MIKLPKITGIIDRRILINYKIDLTILKKYLPAPFEPIEVNGFGIAGICLIRLKNVRPLGLPYFLGIGSENGAHRFAVKWKENGVYKKGVYIPRRDTSSCLNALAGSRIFPGTHFLSTFKIREQQDKYEVGFKHKDGTYLKVVAAASNSFSEHSLFKNIEEVSTFFEEGSIGFSPNKSNCFDCVELNTFTWEVTPLNVKSVSSSFFNDEKIFPRNSIEFDNALLMKNIEHEWIVKETMSV